VTAPTTELKVTVGASRAFQPKDYYPSPVCAQFYFLNLGIFLALPFLTEQTLGQHILVLRTGGFSYATKLDYQRTYGTYKCDKKKNQEKKKSKAKAPCSGWLNLHLNLA